MGAMGDLQGVPHIVVGNEHADAPGGQSLDNAFELGDRDGVDARERLVQEQELGLDGE
jgi:hypothetical protein